MINFSVKAKFSFIIFLIFFAFFQKKSFSQVECRSILGSQFKPISKKVPLYWSAEITGAYGVMQDRNIYNAMIILGLDYQISKNHQLYFEGTGKNWYNDKKVEGNKKDNPNEDKHRGIREAFYRFKNTNNELKIGVQSISAGDYFLVDDRALGINYKSDFGQIKLNSSLLTLTQDFARMQNVCGIRHIYTVAYKTKYNPVGSKIGETNFFSTVLTWKPSDKRSKEKTKSEDEFESFDEFSDDEFSDDEFSPVEKKNEIFKFNEAGLIFYEEFGSGSEFQNYEEFYSYYFGTMANFTLPFDVDLKTQVLFQEIVKNKAMIYYVNFNKNILSKIGNTRLQLGFINKVNIDKNASLQPLFSNLYKGEIIRLNTIDVPLVFATIKQSFKSKIHLFLQTKYALQTSDKTQEFDFEIGAKFFKNHLQVVNIFSYVSSDNDEFTKEEAYYLMNRIELRLVF